MSISEAQQLVDLRAKRAKARDSLNLVEFPLSVLSDRVPSDLKVLEFQDEIRDPSTGKMVTRKLTVDTSQQYGLPTAIDDEVLLGLIQITKQSNDFNDRKVHFSRYELIQLLGWPLSGQSYRRIEDALNRWMRVTLDYQKAWWDHQRKSWVDVKFHVIDQIHLYEVDTTRKPKQASLPFSWFEWNEVVFRSFADGYVKKLNLEDYLKLRLPVARRMYRFLDKRFWRTHTAEFDLQVFAFEHIGLSRKYHTGKIKEKLAPAIAELEASGFLLPMPASERYSSRNRGSWKVKFQRPPDELKIKSPPVALPLVQDLVQRGVTAKIAAKLVEQHPAERIALQVDVHDWMLLQTGKGLQNPGGWLVAAIEGDFSPSPAYAPKEVRERTAKFHEESKRNAAEKLRLQRETDAAEKAQREHVQQFLADLDLDPAKKKVFEAQAIANADAHMQGIIRKGDSLSRFALQAALMSEVLRVSPV